MMRDSMLPLLRYVESKFYYFSASTRNHLPVETPSNSPEVAESCAFMEKVATIAALLVAGKEGLGKSPMDKIVMNLGQARDYHARLNIVRGQVRAEPANSEAVDTYSADMEAVTGIPFRSPLKAMKDSTAKKKKPADDMI